MLKKQLWGGRWRRTYPCLTRHRSMFDPHLTRNCPKACHLGVPKGYHLINLHLYCDITICWTNIKLSWKSQEFLVAFRNTFFTCMLTLSSRWFILFMYICFIFAQLKSLWLFFSFFLSVSHALENFAALIVYRLNSARFSEFNFTSVSVCCFLCESRDSRAENAGEQTQFCMTKADTKPERSRSYWSWHINSFVL